MEARAPIRRLDLAQRPVRLSCFSRLNQVGTVGGVGMGGQAGGGPPEARSGV